jgi:uncharacterized protein YbjT (DUF2867 family)
MKVVIFGASGMVGSGALLECLDDPRVESVLVIGRTACGLTHARLREVLVRDFLDYSSVQPLFRDRDACFFCLGVSAAGKSEAEYRRLTFDLTLAAARSMVEANPAMVFCYVSGEGTDSTARGRVMWARVKGETENALLALPFRAAYMFRPGFIQPQRGVRTKTPLYRAFYTVLAPLYPLLRRVAPAWVTTSTAMGRALIAVAANGHEHRILRSRDINQLGAAPRAGA